jgi:RNA polymerase sigma-70 factor (ECF subfamily)
LSDFAGALGIRTEEAALVEELKAGSEEAYAYLIQHYHQPVYSLVFRMVNDAADAADTTQEVFLKVFRGIGRFRGGSSLKTWIYRIALHEASNRKRWWRRHKSQEITLEAPAGECESVTLQQTLADAGASPLDSAMQSEMRARVEQELQQVPEPYRTTVILRDIEELSYEEIAEIMETTLGTVKSRVTRGREALRKRLERYFQQQGGALSNEDEAESPRQRGFAAGAGVEVLG